MTEIAITTIDNPYNPFTDFDDWFAFDSQYYKSCEYLARIAKTSPELSDEENFNETERAIDEICKFNPSLYRKVVKESN